MRASTMEQKLWMNEMVEAPHAQKNPLKQK